MSALQPTDLLGTWNLVSMDIEDPNGIVRPWGKNTRGRLIYLSNGLMSVAINKDIVPKEGASRSEANFDAILFYSGPYKIEGQSVRHFPDLSSDEERLGQELIRYVQLQGTRLTLSSPPQPWGRGIIVWEKLPSDSTA